MTPKTILFVVIVVVMLAGTTYVAVTSSPSTASNTSTTATVSTTSSSCSTTSTSTTTLTTGSTTTTNASAGNTTTGTFTYSPTLPITVDSVAAVLEPGQNGTQVVFQVAFTNVGDIPVYVMGGCGGGLSSSILSGRGVLKQNVGGPLCDCAAIILTLQTGDNHTSVNPGCWSGYSYQLMGHGSVTMNMTLNWSTGEQGLESSNSTHIQAQFTF